MTHKQTEDGRTRIECRFENETVWPTQALMAELLEIGVNTVKHHLKEVYADRELQEAATVRKYRIVRSEGNALREAVEGREADRNRTTFFFQIFIDLISQVTLYRRLSSHGYETKTHKHRR
jgi:hypothetical protein